MGRNDLATIGAVLGLAIILATVGVAAQQFDLEDWDATFLYDLDDQSEDPIDFTESGTYTKTIDCNGEWNLISSTNDTTTNSDDVIEYAIDAGAGEIGYFERINGSEKRREYACTIYTSPLIETPGGTWSWDEECQGDPQEEDSDDDDVNVTDVGLAPADPPQEVNPAHDPGPDDCVVAAGAAAENLEGFIPYTGRVKALLQDSDGFVSTQATHDMLGGRPFGGASDDPDITGDGDCTTNNCRLEAKRGHFEGTLRDPSAVGHFKGWTESQ